MSDQDVLNVINAVYVVSAIMFIYGMAQLRKPSTARMGNRIAASGMLIAIVATIFDREIVSYYLILPAILIGALIGAWMARTVPMTGMPQMVAIFNASGGIASALVATAAIVRLNQADATVEVDTAIAVALGIGIGTVTFTGSLVAAGKLQGTINQNPVLLPGRNALSLVMGVIVVGLGIALVAAPDQTWLVIPLLISGLLLGILLSIPIGGADMPVLVALFNSYSGLAAAATGFAVENNLLIVAGALVGASGLILTTIMCRAMNRSLANVMFAGFGQSGAVVAQEGERSYRSLNTDDAATMLAYANSAVFVAGYGLAVAQAQHELRKLGDLMTSRGATVRYGIHPVAGRMPGHMNVLLAEADVPYDQLYDLEATNREVGQTEIVLVVGANDVVNPQARTNPDSPIYGMPILNVDEADTCIVMKRSMASGFSGIDNDLFYMDKTAMLFGDAQASLRSLVTEVEEIIRDE